MTVPAHLRYTADHEWLHVEDVATVGITAHAADSLGDVVYVTLPHVGSVVEAGRACGEIESTKSVSELYTPVTGTVLEVNEAVVDDPSLVNSDPYGAGWLFRVSLDGPVGELLDAAAYAALVDGA